MMVGATNGNLIAGPDGGPVGEADPAAVSAFRLDKFEVTVGRFRQFVGAWHAGYTPPAGSGWHIHLNAGRGLNTTGEGYEPGWAATYDGNVAPTDENLACDATFATWTASAGDNENRPINCVNWWEAYAFCVWDAGWLLRGHYVIFLTNPRLRPADGAQWGPASTAALRTERVAS